MHIRKLSDHPELRKLFKRTFPEYKGRKWRVQEQTRPIQINSYWQDGSRDYFRFVRLSDLEVLPVPDSHPAFNAQLPGADYVGNATYEARPGFALVKHSYFCGRDSGLTVYFHPQDAVRLIPATV